MKLFLIMAFVFLAVHLVFHLSGLLAMIVEIPVCLFLNAIISTLHQTY